jgi:hypothetical protein
MEAGTSRKGREYATDGGASNHQGDAPVVQRLQGLLHQREQQMQWHHSRVQRLEERLGYRGKQKGDSAERIDGRHTTKVSHEDSD